MLDKRRQDAPDVAAPRSATVLAIFTVDRDGRVFVGLSAERRPVLGFLLGLFCDETALLVSERIGQRVV